MAKMICETLRVAQKMELPDASACTFAECCDGIECPMFGLTVLGAEALIDEKPTPVLSGEDRFYRRLEAWAALNGRIVQ